MESGINFIDTAPQYGEGRSEKVIGLVLEGVPRRAYYLATKVGCYGGPTAEVGKRFDFTRERTRRSVEDSLKALGVEYIDLVQVRQNAELLYRVNSLQFAVPDPWSRIQLQSGADCHAHAADSL